MLGEKNTQNTVMDFIVLLRIVSITYFLAANVYGFILINFQKKHYQKIAKLQEASIESVNSNGETPPLSQQEKDTPKEKAPIGNFKLYITGLLGGALGIYIAIFVYKYKLSNFLLMVTMPVLFAINLYILLNGFFNGFWIVPMSG